MSRIEKNKNKIQKQDSELEKIIDKQEREIKRLKSQLKSVNEALKTTEEYLIQISKDKTLDFIQDEIKQKTTVSVSHGCPRCKSQDMRKINLGVVTIIACNDCEYRNRLNESGSKGS